MSKFDNVASPFAYEHYLNRYKLTFTIQLLTNNLATKNVAI